MRRRALRFAGFTLNRIYWLLRVLLATTCTPDDRKVVAAARALARRGVEVTVGGDRLLGMAFWSRAVKRRAVYPHPGADPAPFLACLRRLLTEYPHDVLLPTNDYTTMALATAPGALDGLVRMALPDPEAAARAQDKFGLMQLAAALGVETPRTRLIESFDQLPEAADEVGYPCVLKLRRGSGSVGLRIAHSPGDWARFVPGTGGRDLAFDSTAWIVQQRVPGETHDACMICHHGEIRAVITQKRLRTFPAEAGMAVDCITTDEPALIERAALLMRALRWHGPAQAEFKWDPATGRTWLIEINGRPWGALGLSVEAGPDFPWLLCRLALDGDIEPPPPYRVGARLRWPWPIGLLHVLQSRQKWSAFWDLFGPAPHAASDWRWTDPAPHAAELLYIAQRMWRRRRFGPGRRDVIPAAKR